MAKAKEVKKEVKKAPAKTLKEKRADKKAKKASKQLPLQGCEFYRCEARRALTVISPKDRRFVSVL